MPRTHEPGRRIPLTRRLDVRFAVLLCLGAAAILVAAGAWNVHLQRENLTRLTSLNARGTADTILRSTREAMLANDPEGLHRILQAIGSQPGFERIRMFDKQGRILVSTDPGDVGHYVDKAAEQCYACHGAGEPPERLEGAERVRTFTEAGGGKVLGVIAPIRNEPDCSSAACHAHPPERQVLGVLDVQLSLGPVEAQIRASERRLGVGLAGTVLAVLLLAGFLTWRLVLRPVRGLTAATGRVAAGDLSTRAPVESDDEIGGMTAAWNEMVAELSRTRDELQRWSRTLEERVESKTAELREAHRRMLVVEKMASLGKLAAVVAHELNNPLAGIATYARLLRKRVEKAGREAADDETGRILALMADEASRCGDIVRNLLLFSRAPGLRFTSERLGVVLERCALLVRHQAELQSVEVRVEHAPELPPVDCDVSQVQQAVLALAINAIEAMPEGGALTLAVRPGPEPGTQALTVEDTGHGIPPERLERVFEPFFTTKEQGKGVGLGLAIVYGIARRHGGRVDVASRPGLGTTFTLTLPVRHPDGAEPAEPPLLETVP